VEGQGRVAQNGAPETIIDRVFPFDDVLGAFRYAGDDLRGKSLKGANMVLPFHEVFAIRSHSGAPSGLAQLSYIPFISQARNRSTGGINCTL
jgi:hypothetical protein